MTPIVAIWASDLTAGVAEKVSTELEESGFGNGLYSGIDGVGDVESLSRRLVDFHRELIAPSAADTALHVVMIVPVFAGGMTEAVRTVTDAISRSSLRMTLDVIGLQCGLSRVISGCEADPAETGRTVSEIAGFLGGNSRYSFCLIDDYIATGASVRFSVETLGECIALWLTMLIENYQNIFTATIQGALDGNLLGLGMSQLLFPRKKVVDYLLHRAFVSALGKEGITDEAVDISTASYYAAKALDGIDRYFSRFYKQYVADRLNLGENPADIAPGLPARIAEEQIRLMEQLTDFMKSRDLSLPYKEAVLALILGSDNSRLKGYLFRDDNLVLDDALSEPLNEFINAFNADPYSGLLPQRGEYSRLAFPDITDATGEPEPDPDNDKAFNPVPELKKVKAEMMDLTSYIRNTHKRLARLRQSEEDRINSQNVLSEEGYRRGDNVIRNLVRKLPERPLNDKYVPRKDTVLPKSVDLRRLFPEVKDQGPVGACSTFATIAMYEAEMNRTKGSTDAYRTLSEGFLFYSTNVVGGTVDEGSNFFTQLEAMGRTGSCETAFYKYDVSRLDEAPSAEAVKDAEKHRVLKSMQIPLVSGNDRYAAMQANHRILTSALAEGHPVGLALKIYGDFGKDPSGHVGRPASDRTDDAYYHAMVIVGYSEEEQCYIVRNSWGRQFGDDGYCYISAAYVDDTEFNDFCCIIAETTEQAAAVPFEAKDYVASFGSTQSQIQMMALSNALDYARIHYDCMEEYYEECYTYLSNLTAKLDMPSVRNRLRESVERRLSEQAASLGAGAVRLRGEFPSKLKESVRKYVVDAVRLTVVTLTVFVFSVLFCYYDLISLTNVYAVLVNALLITLTVGVWCYFPLFRKKKRTELLREIEELEMAHAMRLKQLEEMRIRFHTAGLVYASVQELRSELTGCYARLQGYNNNLRQWYDEDSRMADNAAYDMPAIYESIVTAEKIDRFFESNQTDITCNIDFIGQFGQFRLTAEDTARVRANLEKVTRRAIGALLDDFNMADYIEGVRRYPYAVDPDLQGQMIRLNRMSAVMTRHRGTGGGESRLVFCMCQQNRRRNFRYRLDPHFETPPGLLQISSPDHLTIVTQKILKLADIV